MKKGGKGKRILGEKNKVKKEDKLRRRRQKKGV